MKRKLLAPLEYVVDGCAAPGNKTTQLAALGAPEIKILATERSPNRTALLRERVNFLGANDYINVVNQDFFSLSSAEREVTDGILLDPSCSASGMISRVDIALGMEGENFDRLERLTHIQQSLLKHALLSFDRCVRVVYSTCSVNEAENENVVRSALSDERVRKRGWFLNKIMPGHWKTRGITREGDEFRMDYTIRCDPLVDKTNGFYVACFQRDIDRK
jgi:putative methyltransferase